MEVEIQEIKQLLKELVLSQKETDNKFKETDSKFKETDSKFKETDIKFKETDKRIKAAFDLFEGQWGKLMESLVEGDLIKLLQAKGINVHDTSMRRKGNYEGNNYEFDIIAHNGTEIVIVEVKTTLKTQDVKAFVQKLKQVRVWLDEYKNFTVYGAIAFLKADSGSEMFAQSEKLFVIKATGNSAMIINADDFVPQKF
ncbi:MAG: YraN family protein [Saprospiraceae bacterium]|jgi:Holliday junction resolvase|nr:YraN family protein [Saprospiraceae bacterium]